MNLSSSESFANDAATGAASYSLAGAAVGSSTSSSANVTVAYDATTRTYTITNGLRSQSFTPADADPGTSNAQISVYKKTSSSTTDSLTLTKPGTAGTLNYQYVGAGFWQRTTDNGSTLSGSFEAFTYGIPTQSSSIVGRGGASYTVDMLGVVTRSDNLYALGGTGLLTVNFLTGQITGGSARVDGVRETPVTGGLPGRSGEWSISATLASNQNSINGQLTLYHNTTDAIGGPVLGRFYGPSSNEIGLAFSGSSLYGDHSVGAILGRRSGDTIAGNNPSLVDLQFDQRLSGYNVGYFDTLDNSTGVVVSEVGLDNRGLSIAYRANGQAFGATESANATPTATFLPTDVVAAKSNSQYTFYETHVGGEAYTLKMYRPGTGNTELALTYSSFAEYIHTKQSLSGSNLTDRYTDIIALGIATDINNVPKTGMASYSGILRGEGMAQAFTGLPKMAMEGTATFNIDFTNSVATSHIMPVLIDPRNGSRYSYGPLDMANPYQTMGMAQITFGGSYSGQVGGLMNPAASMQFMGPHAEEVAGTFYSTYTPPGMVSFAGVMQGAIIAQKNP